MKNKIISLIMVFAILTCSVTIPVWASDTKYNEESAITLVNTLKIMVGNENGDMELDKNVSRAEFAKIAVVMSEYRKTVALAGTTSVFSDCTFKHWASPYVRVAVINGIVTGYPDGTFRPENTVSLEEAITIMLKLTGYKNEDFGTSWPYGQMGIAQSVHLLDNVDKNIGDTLKRRDVLKIVYNTLVSTPKGAQANSKYLEQLDCNLHEDAIIIATNKQNNSVTPGYVLTSAGTFRYIGEFDDSFIGRKGDLITENGNDYAGFMPSVQTVTKHVVYSKLNDTLVTYSGSSITNFKIDSDVSAYVNTTKTTYSAAKNSISTGDTIYLMKDAAGSVDYITVATNNIDGPITVNSSGWYKIFSDDASKLTVMRDGVKSTISDICINDIAYYLADANTVFAYSRKVTGVYEKATPNRDMPTSITVSGKEYTLETASAFNKVSSNGDCKIGDTITLLIGKDGQVANVMSASSSGVVAGYLVSTGTKQFTNADGDKYSSVYATLICPDGNELEVITRKNYSSYINKVMSVTFKDGIAYLTQLTAGGGLYGRADSKNLTIGTTRIAEGANILDITETDSNDSPGSYTVTYIQRLDGIDIEAKKVLYYKKNNRGEVSDIILNNVTGDAYKYGVITDISESGSNEGMSVSSKRYTCDIFGNLNTCTVNYGSTFKKGNPVAFIISGSSIVGMKALNMHAGYVKSVVDGIVSIGANEYIVSDDVSVYRVVAGGSDTSAFTILPMSELENNIEKYSVTAYYDKAENKGGRIRVILAKEK